MLSKLSKFDAEGDVPPPPLAGEGDVGEGDVPPLAGEGDVGEGDVPPLFVRDFACLFTAA